MLFELFMKMGDVSVAVPPLGCRWMLNMLHRMGGHCCT